MKLIKPQKLKKGATVAAVTLSWAGAATFPYRYEIGKKQFEDTFGCNVIETPHALKDHDFIYNNPQARAEDLMWAFKNPDVDAIISIIGGDDSVRILPYIDFDVIKQNPKQFMGYSDSTVTNLICLKAGIESYYGPSFMSGFGENGGIHPYQIDVVKNIIFASGTNTISENKGGWTVEHLDWSNSDNQKIKRTLNPSTGWKLLQGQSNFEGKLIGGCVEVLDMVNGTPLWPSLDVWNGSILFIETSEEAPKPNQFLWWLRNYGAQGILSRISGILVGRPGGSNLIEENYQDYDDVLMQVAKELNLRDLPIISRMDFGHTDPIAVLPVGGDVFVDITEMTITVS